MRKIYIFKYYYKYQGEAKYEKTLTYISNHHNIIRQHKRTSIHAE